MDNITNLLSKKFWLISFLILLVGSVFVFHQQLHADNLFFLYNMQDMLKGERLYVDILDINSPIAYFYNYPAIIISYFTNISDVTSLKLVTICLYIVIFFAYLQILHSLKKRNTNKKQLQAIVASTLFLFFLLLFSGWNFGQREHLLVLLSSPYLLLTLAKTNDFEIDTKKLRFFSGCLAAVGLLLKPHFILVFLLIEIACIVHKYAKPFKKFIKPEHYGFAFTVIIFILLTKVLLPEYWNLFTIGLKTYPGYKTANSTFLSYETFTLFICAIIYLLVSMVKNRYNHTLSMLLIIASGSWLGLVWQQKGFSHHFYPLQVSISMYLLVVVWMLSSSHKFYLKNLLVSPRLIITICLLIIIINTMKPVAQSLNSPLPINKQVLPYGYFLSLAEFYAKEGSVAIIATELYPGSFIQHNSKAKRATHFHNLWFLPGLYNVKDNTQTPFPYHKPQNMGLLESGYFNIMIEDLINNHPKLIYIKTGSYKSGFRTTTFDYEEYYSQEPRFVKLMKSYRLISTKYGYKIYLKDSL